MRKLIYIIVIFFLLLGINITAYAEDDRFGDYTYKLESGYAVITGYTGAGSEIVIPEIVNGYTVRAIGEDAFFRNKNVTKVTMPDTILELRDGAFACCEKLEEIYLSNSLQIIGDEALGECPLLKEVTLPNTIIYIGLDSFKFCSALSAITINNTEKTGYFSVDGVLFWSGQYEGKDYTQLIAYPSNRPGTVYVVPDFVNYICSFSSLQNLEKIIIPSSVTYISMIAFARSVKPIDIILKHEEAPHIGSWAFNTLASGSRIICKDEAVRLAAEKSIYGCDAIAIIATNEELISAEDLQLTSSNEITINPGESAYVSWKQMPQNTTEIVTWESSDATGLTIEPHTGKIKAIYRGTYTVTGKDESGHTLSVKVDVPTLVDHGKIIFYQDWTEYKGVFYVGETYRLNLLSQYSGNQQGISPDTVTVPVWSVSGKRNITTDGRTYFTPYESGIYKITFVEKDKDGIILAQAETTINVIRDESKLLDLSKSFVTLNQYYYSCTGKEIKPRVLGGSIMDVNKDYYTVTYENNKLSGTGYVVFVGRYGAKGTLRVPFYIESLATKLTGKTSYTKQFGDKSFTLDMKANGNQKLQYKSSDTKIVTVSGKGNVTIKKAGTATITVKVSGDSIYADAEKNITIRVKPYPIGKVLLTVTSDRRNAKLSWEQVKNATGYEIYRSTSKNGKYNKIKTITKGSKKTFTNSKLTRKKTYRYKVRAFRVINGTKVYGGYSNAKKIKIK